MRNFINLKLADERDLSDQDIEALNTLHFIMNCVITSYRKKLELGLDGHSDLKAHSEAVEFLEYRMQELWGFSKRRDKHSHKGRLLFGFVETS